MPYMHKMHHIIEQSSTSDIVLEDYQFSRAQEVEFLRCNKNYCRELCDR